MQLLQNPDEFELHQALKQSFKDVEIVFKP